MRCVVYHMFANLYIFLSRELRDKLSQRINALKQRYPRFSARLSIVQAGNRPDSSAYVRMKSKAAAEIGIDFQHIQLPVEATVDEVVDIVKKLNDDDNVSGILVQLPLGYHVGATGERIVTEAISPEKDIDGYACLNTLD